MTGASRCSPTRAGLRWWTLRVHFSAHHPLGQVRAHLQSLSGYIGWPCLGCTAELPRAQDAVASLPEPLDKDDTSAQLPG